MILYTIITAICNVCLYLQQTTFETSEHGFYNQFITFYITIYPIHYWYYNVPTMVVLAHIFRNSATSETLTC